MVGLSLKRNTNNPLKEFLERVVRFSGGKHR
ncbi:hypothetical protein M2277_004028 [Paenibacillus sp. LBL]|nr:hypothetical protein [Paenibacillus sp. LBL]